jgi:hypothetical protein
VHVTLNTSEVDGVPGAVVASCFSLIALRLHCISTLFWLHCSCSQPPTAAPTQAPIVKVTSKPTVVGTTRPTTPVSCFKTAIA